MDKTEIKNGIKVLLARNLDRAMRKHYDLSGEEENKKQTKLANEAKVSQKSISNYLSPLKNEKQDIVDKIPAATIDNLALIANALGMEAWQLLHPNLEKIVQTPAADPNMPEVIELLTLFHAVGEDDRFAALELLRDRAGANGIGGTINERKGL